MAPDDMARGHSMCPGERRGRHGMRSITLYALGTKGSLAGVHRSGMIRYDIPS